MVQHHQVISKGGAGGRGDNRRGSKDDHMTKEREHRREREKFKLKKTMSSGNEKGRSGQVRWGCLAPQELTLLYFLEPVSTY